MGEGNLDSSTEVDNNNAEHQQTTTDREGFSGTERATLLFILGLLIVPIVLYPISDWIQYSSDTGEDRRETLYSNYLGRVGNHTINETNYLIYQWEMISGSWKFEDDFWSEDEWISKATDTRFSFSNNGSKVLQTYSFSFNCEGIFNCEKNEFNFAVLRWRIRTGRFSSSPQITSTVWTPLSSATVKSYI